LKRLTTSLARRERSLGGSAKMKGFSYIISRDYGFAPNPFYGICTLATCKPIVRKHCDVGDYVIGLSPRDRGRGNKLIYLMRVTEVSRFDDYWNDARFACKKPVMNGSLKKAYGDNIYHHDVRGNWLQDDSHHTMPDGSVNEVNLLRDTGTTDRVLISNDFYYWGRNCITLPPDLVRSLTIGVGQRRLEAAVVQKVIDYVDSLDQEKGYLGDPLKFHKFIRYDGR
jgi:hypothetical protein